MSYEIHWSNGRVERGFETHAEACDAIEKEYPDAEIGHDGDLESGGDHTLAWATEAESVDDDGARAVCTIREGN